MATLPTTDLTIHTYGAGEPVLFVHGAGGDYETWLDQLDLADHYHLWLLDLRGAGDSPAPHAPIEIASDVEDIAQLLGDGVHLVGFSYGGALALLAAVRRPEAVHSLAVIEPAAFGLARGNPDADWHMEQMGKVWASAPYVTPEEFDVAFDAAAGFVHEPSQLTPRQRKNVQAVMLRQPPWAADVSLDALAAAPFPKLVFSGGWGGPSNSAADRVGRACEAVCDVLVGQMGAERAVIRGAGHAVQHTGRPFNERLAAFLARAGGA